MARPEQCSDCTKKTTIHFTQIINNKVYKLDMCEDCPLKKEIIDPGNFSLTEIFGAGLEAAQRSRGDLSCKTCGMTEAEFEKRGRFGCPDCYTHFEPAIANLIKDMHYGIRHVGKKPNLAIARVDLNQRVQELKTELSELIESENFEQAAVVRDQILAIEAEIGSLTSSNAS